MPRRPLKTIHFPGCPGRPLRRRLATFPHQKQCGRCRKVLPRREFSIDFSAWDHLQAECRNCRRERYLQRRDVPNGHCRKARGPYKRREPPTEGAFPIVKRDKHDAVLTPKKRTEAFDVIVHLLTSTTATQREIARVCSVSPRTVSRLWRVVKDSLRLKHRPTYRGALSGADARVVLAAVSPLLTGKEAAVPGHVEPAVQASNAAVDEKAARLAELKARFEKIEADKRRAELWMERKNRELDAIEEAGRRRAAAGAGVVGGL